jgi:hypothetical protein
LLHLLTAGYDAVAMPLTPEEFDKYLLEQSALVARPVKAASIRTK